MKITEAENFIHTLQAVVLSNKIYFSQAEDGSFTSTSKKTQKNINTARIAQLAKACWKSVQNEKLSASRREEDNVLLTAGLKIYLKRVNASKPWHRSLISFFGFKSHSEKEIEKLVNESLKQLSAHSLVYLTSVENEMVQFQEESSFHQKIRMLYHKVLDSKQDRPVLNGSKFSESIKSVIEDLIRFQAQLPHKDARVDLLIEELLFAHYLQDALEENEVEDHSPLPKAAEEWIHSCLGQPTLSYGELAKIIVGKLKELAPSKEGSTQAVLIPGGCVLHAMLYSITKQENGTFSFTLINTGAGSLPTKTHGSKRKSFVEIQISEIRKNQLSISFMTQLLKQRSQKSMAEVHHFIRRHLIKPDRSNVHYTSIHTMQQNGTCSVKCLLALLKDRMGKQLNKQYKVFMTITAMKPLASFMNTLMAPFSLFPYRFSEFKALNNDCKTMLKKRKSKALTL